MYAYDNNQQLKNLNICITYMYLNERIYSLFQIVVAISNIILPLYCQIRCLNLQRSKNSWTFSATIKQNLWYATSILNFNRFVKRSSCSFYSIQLHEVRDKWVWSLVVFLSVSWVAKLSLTFLFNWKWFFNHLPRFFGVCPSLYFNPLHWHLSFRSNLIIYGFFP